MAGAHFETQAEVPMRPRKKVRLRANATTSIQLKPIWDLLRRNILTRRCDNPSCNISCLGWVGCGAEDARARQKNTHQM
jgi:hypothetical protein